MARAYNPLVMVKSVSILPSEGIIVVESNVDALWGRTTEFDGVETSPTLDQCSRTGRLLNQHTSKQQHILLNWRERENSQEQEP